MKGIGGVLMDEKKETRRHPVIEFFGTVVACALAIAAVFASVALMCEAVRWLMSILLGLS